MNTKKLNRNVIAVLIFLLVSGIYCTKQDLSQDQSKKLSLEKEVAGLKLTTKAQSTKIRTHPKESPVDKNALKSKNESTISSNLPNSSTYTCGETFYDQYENTGAHQYQTMPLNFSNYPTSNVGVNVIFSSWSIPNKFTIYHPLGAIVVTTGWIGYTQYAGPWGASLNKSSDVELKFVAKNTVGYTLKVETYVNENYDYWEAQFICGSVLDQLNQAGQLHNDYQEYVFSYLESQNVNFQDTTLMAHILQAKGQEFFNSNGIYETMPITYFAHYGPNSTDFPVSGYSTAGTQILNQLKSIVFDSTANYNASFFSALNNLQQQASNLANPSEVYTVGLPVTIAIHSFTYWLNNADRWASTFYQDAAAVSSSTTYSKNKKLNQTQNGSMLYAARPCKIAMNKLGGADVVGAFAGAKSGLGFAGIHGALAGGVLGAAGASATDLGNQIISCYVPWWPF